MFFHHGKNNDERMIFPEEGPYNEKEETKYEEFKEYVENLGATLPEVMTKRRIMRFLLANHMKIKNTYENIIQHLEWREKMKPIILTENHKKMLD